jgi:hypothetical protein
MDCLEFIVRVTSHIPDKGQVTVRYCGLCATTLKEDHNSRRFEVDIIIGLRMPGGGWLGLKGTS